VTDKRDQVERTARRRGETPEEVLDRNLSDVLQELRVVLTGVSVLLGFVLTLAFTADLDRRGAFATTAYTVTLLCIASATVVLVAPVSFHRLLFRQQRREQLVAFADRSLLAGLGLLLVGIAGAVLLVLDWVLGRWPAVAGSALVTAVALVTWYAVPLRQRHRADD
jgi:O-antigen/teichoic acid export membrane protein